MLGISTNTVYIVPFLIRGAGIMYRLGEYVFVYIYLCLQYLSKYPASLGIAEYLQSVLYKRLLRQALYILYSGFTGKGISFISGDGDRGCSTCCENPCKIQQVYICYITNNIVYFSLKKFRTPVSYPTLIVNTTALYELPSAREDWKRNSWTGRVT